MKNIFEVDKEEKKRILEMHINATLRNYLMEELDYQYRPTQDWAKIANLLISYGASCYIQEDNLGKRTKTSSGTKLYREGQTKPTYCELAIKNLEDKSNDPNYRQYSTYNNEIYFSQHGYYKKTVRGYNGGSGYYILSKDRKNLIDRDSKTELLDATIGATSKCPFTRPEDIKGFRNWLNSTYPDVATKFDVDKDRTDCTPQAINAMYYIKDGVEPLWKVYQKNEKTKLDNMQKQVQAQKKSEDEMMKVDITATADSTNTKYTKNDYYTGLKVETSPEFNAWWNNMTAEQKENYLKEPQEESSLNIGLMVDLLSAACEFIPGLGTVASTIIDIVHGIADICIGIATMSSNLIDGLISLVSGCIGIITSVIPVVGNAAKIGAVNAIKTIVKNSDEAIMAFKTLTNLTKTKKIILAMVEAAGKSIGSGFTIETILNALNWVYEKFGWMDWVAEGVNSAINEFKPLLQYK